MRLTAFSANIDTKHESGLYNKPVTCMHSYSTYTHTAMNTKKFRWPQCQRNSQDRDCVYFQSLIAQVLLIFHLGRFPLFFSGEYKLPFHLYY